MPVLKCSNGKYRIGSGDCIYKSRASAERAYAGYRAEKYTESTLRDWINIVEQSTLQEASPNTLEGSFTPDLVASKRWLTQQLKQHLEDNDAGTVYVPGSWYGNMGMFLVDAHIDFDRLILIELEQELLDASKDLLWALDKHHKLETQQKSAESVEYVDPCTVINCACNEMGPGFLSKLPEGTLVALQGRSHTTESEHTTASLEDFDQMFPLSETLYLDQMDLEDPEMSYQRFLKIGRI